MPIDVCSTFIIMFSIFGAFLRKCGAGKFYVDFAFTAMGSKPTGAGRTVVLSSYFLAGGSGWGVADTVTMGSVAYPMLQRAGYDHANAGGFLAAGGLGRYSPLRSWARLPSSLPSSSGSGIWTSSCWRCSRVLYYWGLLLMVEFDARKFRMTLVELERAHDRSRPSSGCTGFTSSRFGFGSLPGEGLHPADVRLRRHHDLHSIMFYPEGDPLHPD